MIPLRLMLAAFVVTVAAYVGISFLVWQPPASLLEGEACGFTSADFDASGALQYSRADAWRVSFGRTQEYFSAASLGLIVAFLAFVVARGRFLGGAFASGAAVGGGMLAVGAVCLSCLAPALSLIGLGVATAALSGIPKWLMTFNIFVVLAWGTLFIARRLSTCSLRPPVAGAACATPANVLPSTANSK